jgi:DNA polymerase III subunit delta
VPSFKPAYLIHGDDHGRIGERRAKLRAVAEADSGPGDVEVFENDACTADAVAGALSAMTFALGRRFVIADGVERWKEADVEPVAAAMKGMDPEALTVAFFAREEGRYKAPAKLRDAVTKVGGKVAAEVNVKGKELPGWVIEQAKELGLRMDRNAARALIAQVGDRQQRLTRELEKLALEHGKGATVGTAEVEESCATSAERKVWTLADALVDGDRRTALATLLELRQQGERITGLTYRMAGKLREAAMVADALAAGQSKAQAKKLLRGAPWAADRTIAAIEKRDAETLRRAVAAIADLEVQTRGGELSEDTEAVRAVLIATR